MFEDIGSLSNHIKRDVFKTKKISLIYAFNGAGKTRLASSFNTDDEHIESMIYNAHFEDMFIWDNDNNEIHFSYENYWLFKFIQDEGLDGDIADDFKRHTLSRIEPVLDFSTGVIRFRLIADNEDESTNESIKISRAEESLLLWSIFYAVLSRAIELLLEKQEDRSSDIFNRLKYVVIDDPVSSMDDTRLIGLAMDVADISRRLIELENTIKVLILTHHGLFYNVVYNILNKKINKLQAYSLSRKGGELLLDDQKDTPFAYHLFAKSEIQKAIATDTIERYHFNMFRALLEKTASFLGYKSWDKCLGNIAEDEFVKRINQYSHSQQSDLESRTLPTDEIEQFKEVFNSFITEYNWNIDDGK